MHATRFTQPIGDPPRRTVIERAEQIGPGRRLTRRLRERLETAVSGSARSVADIAREYGVSWRSVHQALVARAADLLGPAPTGVRWLGVDERAASAGCCPAPDGGQRTVRALQAARMTSSAPDPHSEWSRDRRQC